MEHRLVLAVFTKECDILAKIHIFEMISDKTAVATLDALAKFIKDVILRFHKLQKLAHPLPQMVMTT